MKQDGFYKNTGSYLLKTGLILYGIYLGVSNHEVITSFVKEYMNEIPNIEGITKKPEHKRTSEDVLEDIVDFRRNLE